MVSLPEIPRSPAQPWKVAAHLPDHVTYSAWAAMTRYRRSRSTLLGASVGREQFENKNAQTRRNIKEVQTPESRTGHQEREPSEIRKTSTPGSNPGGASETKPNRHCRFSRNKYYYSHYYGHQYKNYYSCAAA